MPSGVYVGVCVGLGCYDTGYGYADVGVTCYYDADCDDYGDADVGIDDRIEITAVVDNDDGGDADIADYGYVDTGGDVGAPSTSALSSPPAPPSPPISTYTPTSTVT